MEAINPFITITALIGEPARAKILWSLLDGRSYTASELAIAADISPTAASNHLSKLLAADLLKVDVQGRHRYFSFARPEVAYVVESLASLTNGDTKTKAVTTTMPEIKYCRTCYDHLAGYAGVCVTEAMEKKGLIKKSGTAYGITNKGWKWLSQFDILENDVANKRRSLTRQCLDWSERRPHLAGQIGALLLEKMMEKRWFKKVQFSRAMIVTARGQSELYNLLGIEI